MKAKWPLVRMCLLCMALLPAAVPAQLLFVTNNAAIAITGYNGPGGAVLIPAATNGFPVTFIGSGAFSNKTTITSVTIPNSVTIIGTNAFYLCTSLTNITIGSGVTNIGNGAFTNCALLKGAYFQGNAPGLGSAVFTGDNNATVYYLPGTSGWSSPFGGRPAVMLNPPTSAGSLTVFIYPAAANTAGAQWQVDGGVAQPGGAMVSGLSVGTHTLTFNALNGWAMPASQSVTVSANWTTVAYVSYAQLLYSTYYGSEVSIYQFNNGYGNFGVMILPGTINGLPVTGISGSAFKYVQLTGLMIPASITSIATGVFQYGGLGSITVDTNNPAYSSLAGVLFNKHQTMLDLYPSGMTGIYTVPSTVTNIGDFAFNSCSSLTTVTIGAGVTNIDGMPFPSCPNLTGIYFRGDAPDVNQYAYSPYTLDSSGMATVYYLPGTAGWPAPGDQFHGNSIAPWLPQAQTGAPNFGVQSNQFGFNINWVSGRTIVVEACTDLSNPVWAPVSTNTLTGDSCYFSDPQWTNYPGRYYRLRSP